jgi:hypothetical protein
MMFGLCGGLSYLGAVANSCAKYYRPTEHFAVNEIIVSFKGRVIFKEYIPKKHKQFGIKHYKLCDSRGYTYYDSGFRQTQEMCDAFRDSYTGNLTGLAARIEYVRHKLYVDSFFSSQALFDDLHNKTINCCGTVRPNRNGTV